MVFEQQHVVLDRLRRRVNAFERALQRAAQRADGRDARRRSDGDRVLFLDHLHVVEGDLGGEPHAELVIHRARDPLADLLIRQRRVGDRLDGAAGRLDGLDHRIAQQPVVEVGRMIGEGSLGDVLISDRVRLGLHAREAVAEADDDLVDQLMARGQRDGERAVQHVLGGERQVRRRRRRPRGHAQRAGNAALAGGRARRKPVLQPPPAGGCRVEDRRRVPAARRQRIDGGVIERGDEVLQVVGAAQGDRSRFQIERRRVDQAGEQPLNVGRRTARLVGNVDRD